MAQYTRLTTAALTSLASTTLGNLHPYQIRQVAEFLARVNWGKASANLGVDPDIGRGTESDVTQPTITQIITLIGANNP
jgi:hypothetical protein